MGSIGPLPQGAFFEVVRELMASATAPTAAHWFLRVLESKGVLRRLYTQNIDNLERYAMLITRRL